MVQKHRSVRRSQLFERCCAGLGDARQLDEHLEGAEWAASRDPYDFREIPGTAARVMPLEAARGFARLRLFYLIESDDQIAFEFIEQIPEPIEED